MKLILAGWFGEPQSRSAELKEIGWIEVDSDQESVVGLKLEELGVQCADNGECLGTKLPAVYAWQYDVVIEIGTPRDEEFLKELPQINDEFQLEELITKLR